MTADWHCLHFSISIQCLYLDWLRIFSANQNCFEWI